MKRRTFLSVIAGSLLAAPLAVEGEQAGQRRRQVFEALLAEEELLGTLPLECARW